MLEAIHRFTSESRAIDAILLPASAAGEIKAPGAEEIKKFYVEREFAFRAREFRKFTILAATPAALAKPQDIPEAEVRKLYDWSRTSVTEPRRSAKSRNSSSRARRKPEMRWSVSRAVSPSTRSSPSASSIQKTSISGS